MRTQPLSCRPVMTSLGRAFRCADERAEAEIIPTDGLDISAARSNGLKLAARACTAGS
jgi:hypothetical protein